MGANRVFFPQQALDAWLEQGRIALVGDELTITPEGRRYSAHDARCGSWPRWRKTTTPATWWARSRPSSRCRSSRVSTTPGSVIIGDNAYEVVDGFLGEPAALSNKSAARRSLAERQGARSRQTRTTRSAAACSRRSAHGHRHRHLHRRAARSTRCRARCSSRTSGAATSRASAGRRACSASRWSRTRCSSPATTRCSATRRCATSTTARPCSRC